METQDYSHSENSTLAARWLLEQHHADIELMRAMHELTGDEVLQAVSQYQQLRREASKPKPPVVDERFGGCPVCGQSDGYMNFGGSHWFSSVEHKTAWCAGYNLFSSWKDEGEDIWDSNAEKLEGFRVVEPLREGAPVPAKFGGSS